MKNGIRYEQFRLAKRLAPNNPWASITELQYEYFTQARYVWAGSKRVAKWWEFWKAEYEMVYEYEEWRDIPAVEVK